MKQESPIGTSLYGCLDLLLRIQESELSMEEVLHGLPITGRKLGPKVFIRAASRAGIKATIEKKPLKTLLKNRLPMIILLEPEQAVLAEKYDPEKQKITVIDPETEEEVEIGLGTVEEKYIGFGIVLHLSALEDFLEIEQGENNNKWFWGSLFKSLPIYRDVLVASLLINIFAVASPLFIMNVYDRVVPNYAFDTLWVLFVGVIIIFTFDLLLKVLRGYFVDIAGKRVDLDLSAQLYHHVLGIKMAARPESVGAFANNLEEFESIRNFITSATITTLVDIPFVVIFLAVIWLVGGPIVLVPVIAIPLILGYALLLQPVIKQSVNRVMSGAARKNATLVESLVGIETVKALGAENRQQSRWESAVEYIAHWGIRSRMLSSSVVNIAIYLQQMAVIGVVVYGVYLIADGNLSLGGLIAAVILTSRVLAPMAQVANLATHYHQASNALKTVSSILRLPAEFDSTRNYLSPNKINGAIEFEAVTFSYPGESKKALNNVSVSIKPGERVGVIGRTGSGKSTFGKLIAGLYSENDGFVRIDGVDVRQINPVLLRKNIGYMPQDVILFSGTMKENIVFGKEDTVHDEDIIHAAEQSGVMKVIKSHPSGFDMHIGERGNGLSGGQRQGVAIARAMLGNPRILIMDEPSNSMDNATEVELKSRLREYAANKTFVLITHKASMLDIVDRLVVFEGGRVIADGEKNEVLTALQSH